MTHPKECIEVCSESNFNFGESSNTQNGSSPFSLHDENITKLSIFILCYKSKYSVSSVMSRRQFCFTGSYSLYSFIDSCDVAWLLLVLQCFFLVVLRGSKSKQQKNCMAIRLNIEMSFHVVESATGSQEAINFVSLLIHVSFALFLISFMEESASHPTSAFPEAECPKWAYLLEMLLECKRLYLEM